MEINDILCYHLKNIEDINICIVDNLKNIILETDKNLNISVINKIFNNFSFYSIPRMMNDNIIITPIFFYKQIVGFIIIKSDIKKISCDLNFWRWLSDLICYTIIRSYDFSYLNLYSYERFTVMEKKIVSHLISGKRDKDIANNLNISIPTVRKHIQNIFSKEKVSNKYEFLIKYYTESVLS